MYWTSLSDAEEAGVLTWFFNRRLRLSLRLLGIRQSAGLINHEWIPNKIEQCHGVGGLPCPL